MQPARRLQAVGQLASRCTAPPSAFAISDLIAFPANLDAMLPPLKPPPPTSSSFSFLTNWNFPAGSIWWLPPPNPPISSDVRLCLPPSAAPSCSDVCSSRRSCTALREVLCAVGLVGTVVKKKHRGRRAETAAPILAGFLEQKCDSHHSPARTALSDHRRSIARARTSPRTRSRQFVYA
jgi:hypothetical protein